MAGAVSLAMLIARIPISVQGWGLFDASFVVLMSLAGVSAAQAIAITLVFRILQIVAWLPWWMAHVFDAGSLRPPSTANLGTKQ